jgi:type I restriction enzyme S subunit
MRPERKRRYPNGAELREDLDLPELPTDWTWTNLRLLSEPTEALCYGVVQPGPEVDDGVPLVRAGDLHDLPGSLAGLRKVTRDIDASYARSRLRGGEVLVTVVGANVGVAAIAPPSTRGFNIARAVAKLPIREVEGRYVLLWLQSSLAYRWMFGDTREVARPTLNIEQLESLPVPLPPLEEQAEIVRQVESLFALAGNIERRVQAATARASHLPQAILSNAFSGELVPTEADLARAEGRMYETAEELLARVRGERENGVGEVSSARHGVRGSGDVRSSRSAR